MYLKYYSDIAQNYPQVYPQPVDFFVEKLRAKLPLYDDMKKIPEISAEYNKIDILSYRNVDK
jgi:hypothetical protein